MTIEKGLKKYRKLGNLTQEELSRTSGISIRTIQRMEKGLSVGSPHTIKALARTLNIESSDLLSEGIESNRIEKDSISKVKIMNLSILLLIFLPFINIIIPFIIFFRNKRIDRKVNLLGRKILSFQILCLLAIPFLMIITFVFFGGGNGAIPLGVSVSYFIYLTVNIIFTTRTAIRINQEKEILTLTPNIL